MPQRSEAGDRWFARGAYALVLLCVCGTACGRGSCVTPPCPQFRAITISVRAPHGGLLTGATVSFSGAATGSVPCESGDPATCNVFGPRGDYDLVVSAPGYSPVERTVHVAGDAAAACGCATVTTQSIDITLPATG